MDSFITAITATEGGITAANLWATIAAGAGLLATLVLFSFAYRFIRRLISGASKGKAKA